MVRANGGGVPPIKLWIAGAYATRVHTFLDVRVDPLRATLMKRETAQPYCHRRRGRAEDVAARC